eukprot:TRINITY_DN59193_c0_g1_i1.p1 TRINITY_DN59193_c0_g1~~TRINITY_DN59193_c0_g1_i1.p1  ORF type:complete len:1038 (-),score=126.78 TRINITY_DN59193_c0_g1_i1:350-3463(-)
MNTSISTPLRTIPASGPRGRHVGDNETPFTGSRSYAGSMLSPTTPGLLHSGSAVAAVPTDLCYGMRIGIRSCAEQRYVAAFPRMNGTSSDATSSARRVGDLFDVEVSGYHPFRQLEASVTDRTSECPSEWVLLNYSSRQHRGPVRLGDEVCFAKELALPVERRKDRLVYLALEHSPEGDALEPAVEREEIASELCKWKLLSPEEPESRDKVQASTPLVIRGQYDEVLAAGRPLIDLLTGGSASASSSKSFRSPTRVSGRQLGLRTGRGAKAPESMFRLLKAGLPFAADAIGSVKTVPQGPPPVMRSDPEEDFATKSVQEQEQELLEDVLFSLLGLDGTHIRQTTTSSPSGALGASRFELQAPAGADTSNIQFLRQVLPLCDHHAAVQRFVEVQGQYEYGTVNHALSSAIRELLKEFSIKVGQLETSLRAGNLSIAKLWYYVQPSIDTMAVLHQVVNHVFEMTGGMVLNGIEEVMLRSSLTTAQDLCEYLLQQASRPYFETISRWVYNGQLDDPYGEFFISESGRGRDERSGGPAADFWHKHFLLDERVVPQFLMASRDKILHAGKYLHVFFSASPGAELEEPGKRGLLRYSRRRKDCADALDEAYRRASAALLGLFMAPTPGGLDLPGRLRSMRSFFFLAKADWFGQLMDTACSVLEQPAAEVPLARLEGLLDLAIRTSSAASDPYREDIVCTMHSFRIEEACNRMSRGHTMLAEEADEDSAQGGRSSNRPPASRSAAGAATTPQMADTSVLGLTPSLLAGTQNLAGESSGVQCFTLKYKTSWPLSIVFSRALLLKYQVIFRHLLFCRYVERKLVDVWVDHQHTKGLGLDSSFSPSYCLRQRMLHFCRDYIYYATVEVLEPQSHRFLSSLSQADSIDEVLRSHERFLDTCLREVLLTERDSLYKGLSKVLHTCLTFAYKMHKFSEDGNDKVSGAEPSPSSLSAASRMAKERERGNKYVSLLTQKTYSTMISKFKVVFETQLQAFLAQIRKESSSRHEHFLSNMLTRLDYNDYYSSLLPGASLSVSGVGDLPTSFAGE